MEQSSVQRPTRHSLGHFEGGLHSQYHLTDTEKQNSKGKYTDL